jgi:hypothetical protein
VRASLAVRFLMKPACVLAMMALNGTFRRGLGNHMPARIKLAGR